jgi:hypothetical protein
LLGGLLGDAGLLLAHDRTIVTKSVMHSRRVKQEVGTKAHAPLLF